MINLEKKKPFNLSKQLQGLSKVRVGLSWDATPEGKSPDADASIFMLNDSFKIPDEGYFVFFNNTRSSDGSVVHSGDNRTGHGEGDDETIDIDLSKVNSQVLQIIIVITIHNANEGFHFGNVLNSSVRIYDDSKNSILCQYNLMESFDGCDALQIGRFFRMGQEWQFEVMGEAFTGGLEATVQLYA